MLNICNIDTIISHQYNYTAFISVVQVGFRNKGKIPIFDRSKVLKKTVYISLFMWHIGETKN